MENCVVGLWLNGEENEFFFPFSGHIFSRELEQFFEARFSTIFRYFFLLCVLFSVASASEEWGNLLSLWHFQWS